MPDAPRVSLVTVTFNSGAVLVPFLEAVGRVRHPHLEIIVVDNGSRDGTADLVRRTLPAAIVVEAGRNLGFAAGSNLGASRATGDVLLFLNPDTLPPADLVEQLCGPVWQRPELGAVGPKLLFPDGRIQSAGGAIRPDAFANNRGRGEPDTGQYDEEAVVDYVPGAVLAIRRSLFLDLGGFFPGYFPGFYEDVELGVRLRQRGLQVRYLPSPPVVHVEGHAMARRVDYWVHRNRVLFLWRNPHFHPDAPGPNAEPRRFWRTYVRPLLAALTSRHSMTLRDTWRGMQPAAMGTLAGMAAALAARVPAACRLRQVRRLRWLGEDVAGLLRSLPETVHHTRHDGPELGLAALTADPWAVRGETNGYAVRIANAGAESCEVDLALRAVIAGGPSFMLTTRKKVDPRSVTEVTLATDWIARCELVTECGPRDPTRFLVAPEVVGECRVAAELSVAGRPHGALSVAQPLAR